MENTILFCFNLLKNEMSTKLKLIMHEWNHQSILSWWYLTIQNRTLLETALVLFTDQIWKSGCLILKLLSFLLISPKSWCNSSTDTRHLQILRSITKKVFRTCQNYLLLLLSSPIEYWPSSRHFSPSRLQPEMKNAQITARNV